MNLNICWKIFKSCAPIIFLNYSEEVTETLQEEDKKAEERSSSNLWKEKRKSSESNSTWLQPKLGLKASRL